MVSLAAQLASTTLLWGAQQPKTEPLLMRLDPPSRTMVIMSLLGLVIFGVALTALVLIGGRRLRRIARQRLPATPDNHDQGYAKPLAPPSPPQGGDNEGP
jgi:hypothetical protein